VEDEGLEEEMTCKSAVRGLAVVAGLLAMAAPASANWTTNSDASGRAVNSNMSGGALITVNPTGAASQGISCTDASMSGALLAGGSSGAQLMYQVFDFGGCKVVGQNAAARCVASWFAATVYDPAMSLTTGSFTAVGCQFTKAACGNSTTITGGISITGSVPVSYGNTNQQMTIPTTGQNLSAAWTGMGCLMGSSPAYTTLKSATGTAATYAVSSAFKPQITN
jgi:hypothetical protein